MFLRDPFITNAMRGADKRLVSDFAYRREGEVVSTKCVGLYAK